MSQDKLMSEVILDMVSEAPASFQFLSERLIGKKPKKIQKVIFRVLINQLAYEGEIVVERQDGQPEILKRSASRG